MMMRNFLARCGSHLRACERVSAGAQDAETVALALVEVNRFVGSEYLLTECAAAYAEYAWNGECRERNLSQLAELVASQLN